MLTVLGPVVFVMMDVLGAISLVCFCFCVCLRVDVVCGLGLFGWF